MNDLKIYIELIYQFLDGEVSEIERQTLFQSLNTYPELQLEFQSAVSLNNAAKSFAESSKVPANVTSQLFNRAGLSYKPTTTIPATSTTIQTALKSNIFSLLFSKYGIGVIGLVSGIILSLTFSGIIFNSSEDNDGLISKNEKTSDVKTLYIPVLQDENQNTNTFAANKKSNISKTVKHTINKMVAVDEDEILDAGENKIIGMNDEDSLFPMLENSDLVKIGFYDKKQLSSNYAVNEIYGTENEGSNDELYGSVNHRDYFGLEVNSSMFWNLPKETISPEEINKLHNMNLFLFYTPLDYISLGFGIRQETFYVNYDSRDDLNQDFIFEQQPNLTNFEFSIRYLPYEYSMFKPFAQVNLGGGKFGYTYRLGLGSEMTIYDKISFQIFLEYASLRYNHLSNWNSANKWGLNYGINYKF